MENLKFPIGQFSFQPPSTPPQRKQWIADIAGAAAKYRAAVSGLTAEQLDTPYRDGGWTVRQVIHHVPDSHMNAYIRFKLALTENDPTIKPYDEAAWAELSDSRDTPIEVSLTLLETLHARWVSLMDAMSDSDFLKQFRHPERGVVPLEMNLALYAWHCHHHLAHITSLRARNKW
jgi:DinB superfamily